MKADSDTYVIAENLRYLLSDYKPSQAIYFGQHFSMIVANGYMSGGAGYVYSREALRRYGEHGHTQLCNNSQGIDDVDIGTCFQTLGILPGDSRDKLGRSSFHCLPPDPAVHTGMPKWLEVYLKFFDKNFTGMESVSDYPISFHWVSKDTMYMLEYYIYHLRPYGILEGLQDLNRNDTKPVTPSPRTPQPSTPKPSTSKVSTQ